jgi:prepilin signal peptidase PulO-like enzyme (type II secretory pathway)
MPADGRAVRRVDLGAGVYVAVPAAPTRRVPPYALAIGAVLSAAALARHGMSAEGVLAAGLLPVLAALAAVDIRARVLPNRIIGPAVLLVLLWQLAVSTERVPEYLLAGVGAGAFLLLPSLVQPGAMGMGDVKLAALLGLALGAEVAAALMVGFIAVAPVAVALLVSRRSDPRATAIPFGPFLALGAAVALLA